VVAAPEVLRALADHEQWLLEQCLAVGVRHAPLADAEVSATVDVDSHRVDLALARRRSAGRPAAAPPS